MRYPRPPYNDALAHDLRICSDNLVLIIMFKSTWFVLQKHGLGHESQMYLCNSTRDLHFFHAWHFLCLIFVHHYVWSFGEKKTHLCTYIVKVCEQMCMEHSVQAGWALAEDSTLKEVWKELLLHQSDCLHATKSVLIKSNPCWYVACFTAHTTLRGHCAGKWVKCPGWSNRDSGQGCPNRLPLHLLCSGEAGTAHDMSVCLNDMSRTGVECDTYSLAWNTPGYCWDPF